MGRSVRDIAASFGKSKTALHRRKVVGLKTRGLRPSTDGGESEPLTAVRRRIRDLDKEDQVTVLARRLGGLPEDLLSVVVQVRLLVLTESAHVPMNVQRDAMHDAGAHRR